MATHVPTPPLSGSISVEAPEVALAEELAEKDSLWSWLPH